MRSVTKRHLMEGCQINYTFASIGKQGRRREGSGWPWAYIIQEYLWFNMLSACSMAPPNKMGTSSTSHTHTAPPSEVVLAAPL